MAEESSATQQFVDVEDVRDGVVILKDGSMRKILLVSGINFALKSEEDKNIILNAYQEFLNSLDFSLQVIIHSRKLNIEAYIQHLKEREGGEQNALLKQQINEYGEFIKSFVEQSAIMTKTFFVVIPFTPITIGEDAGKLLNKLPFFGKKMTTQSEKNQTFEERVEQLNQRTDHVAIGLSSIGLRAIALNTEEIVELFYNLYNPQGTEKKGLAIAKGKA